MIFGVVCVLTGIVWFLQSIGWVDDTIWSLYLPLVLVVIGLSILFHSQENECILCRMWDNGEEKKVKPIITPAVIKPKVIEKKEEKKPTKTTVKKKKIAKK